MSLYSSLKECAIILLMPMIFLPSVTFGLIKSEIFPYATIFSALIFKASFRDWSFFAFVAYLTLSAFAVLIINSAMGLNQDAFRSLFAYINPLVVFFTLSAADSKYCRRIKTIVLSMFIIFIILGFLQVSNLFHWVDPLNKFLVPRSSMGTDETRGVSLLSTEPARAGVELTLMYYFLRCVYKTKFALLCDILFLIYVLLVVKSAIAFAFVAFATFVFNKRLGFATIVIFLLVLFATPDVIILENNRALLMISKIHNSNFSIYDIINDSGNRIVSILSFYPYGLVYPFGGGVGNWPYTSVEALKLIDYPYKSLNFFATTLGNYNEGMRGSGFITNLFLDAGVFGFLLFIKFIKNAFARFDLNARNVKYYIYIFAFNIAFIGSVGLPVAWVLLITILKINDSKSDEFKI